MINTLYSTFSLILKLSPVVVLECNVSLDYKEDYKSALSFHLNCDIFALCTVIEIVDDNIAEMTETLTISLETDLAIEITPNSTILVTIQDDDGL